MKKVEFLFKKYSFTHQNTYNEIIHLICVPTILFSAFGLALSLPMAWGLPKTFILNWAAFIFVFLMIYYVRLSLKVALSMLPILLLCFYGNQFMYQNHTIPLGRISLLLFVGGWVGQLVGHKLEGERPSFFEDLQFLLIGPPWVLWNLLGRLGIKF